ncbi:hypothetical protein BpHYR1_053830 [Brachionus plicatilis]|uniref:Uncharacterized protein n=1 Tax=Brachionus plicatilis TaxID=10195 RepID=A0A3M7R4L5_BRAPC|nr:hypothetical protein BpHYR1_053830 [Brachionus plicatilis]
MSNISSILNSIVSQQTPTCEAFNNFNRLNTNNPSFSDFNNRKSDIVVEWTDSMNDVSLSGCFFSDLQTAENKDTKKTIISEASRDSFFYNMDSMMEILPSAVNRFDESSLLNNSMNTVDNVVGKNLSK